MIWPKTADGDVFRRLEQSDFDFAQKYWVDFNIDFDRWPPDKLAVSKLKEEYRQVELVEPEDNLGGYIEVKIYAHLTYDFVIEQQEIFSRMMSDAHGRCESWGVLQE